MAAISLDKDQSFGTTHDVSRSHYHIKELSDFLKDVNDAVKSAFPNKKKKPRYTSVYVLLVSWEEDNLGVEKEIAELRGVFKTAYNFNTDLFKIPSIKAQRSLTQRLITFIEDHESRDTLLILYYGGHGCIDDTRSCVWSCTEKPDSPTLQWSHVQSQFDESQSDILLLLDCCAAGSSGASTYGSSVREVIAACGFETWAPGVGRHSFTAGLIKELQYLAIESPFSAAELHTMVLQRAMRGYNPRYEQDPRYERIEKRKTPLHILLSRSVEYGSIELSPIVLEGEVEQSAITRTTEIAHCSMPQFPNALISVSLRISSGQDLGLSIKEELIEWLKNVPILANSAHVEGIFESESTLLLLSLPVPVWDLLSENPAVSFVGFVRSGNLLDSTYQKINVLSKSDFSTYRMPDRRIQPPRSYLPSSAEELSPAWSWQLPKVVPNTKVSLPSLNLDLSTKQDFKSGPMFAQEARRAKGGGAMSLLAYEKKTIPSYPNINERKRLRRRMYLADDDQEEETAILGEASDGDSIEIGKLLESGANIHITGRDGSTALHIAVNRSFMGAVQLLIEHGADINAPNIDKQTPLHIAVDRSFMAAVQLLIQHGADVNVPDIDKQTPLHIAVDRSFMAAVQLLIEHGADINAPNIDKQTPLHIAVDRSFMAAVQLLIQHGADINAPNIHK